MKHKVRSLVFLLVIGLIIFFLLPKETKEIETVKVTRQRVIESVSATGSIESKTIVNLSFIAGGKIVYVGAREGDDVTAGQTIAALDQRSLYKTLEQKVREYWQQKNTFDEIQEDNQNRQPYQALNDEMRRVLENNQYNLEKTVNSVDLQNLSIEQAYLITPVSGVLVRADIEVPGLTATATTTYTVADPQNLIFNVEVDEADIGKISLGQRVQVTLDAYPDNTIPLEITKIDFASHASDTGGTVYSVEASMPKNSDFRYRIGMNGDAEIIIAEKGNVISIPIASMLDEKHVYVKKEKTFEKRAIRTGLQSDTDIEVVSGLREGEEIALQPEEVEKLTK